MTSTFNKVLFWILVLGNIVGAFFGFTYWYGPQLVANSWIYWIFIATCPFYALMFVVCALLIWFKKKSSILYFLVAVGLVKYGTWTVLFWLNQGMAGVNPLMFYWLIGSHFIMVVEAAVLFSRIEFKKWHLVAAWVWFGLNDYYNYWLKFVTDRVTIGSREMYIAIALTVVAPLIVYWLVKVFRHKNWRLI